MKTEVFTEYQITALTIIKGFAGKGHSCHITYDNGHMKGTVVINGETILDLLEKIKTEITP